MKILLLFATILLNMHVYALALLSINTEQFGPELTVEGLAERIDILALFDYTRKLAAGKSRLYSPFFAKLSFGKKV